jgi:release factor glutamine methyltransferase
MGGEATIAGLLREGGRVLAASGIDNPRLESRLLLAHSLGVSSEDLIRDLGAAANPSDFGDLIARRAGHEPLAYILGWREFWSLRFRVSPATLIPRPDSEAVVEAALGLSPDPRSSPCVLDLGTGTGCLLLAFLHERPLASGIGVDRSEAAARIARCNAGDLKLDGRAAFVCADWAASLRGRFDIVLSNPPYIPSGELAGLMPEVAGYEPWGALDGGGDGLAAYRAIIATLGRLLRPGGAAVLELGQGESEAVAAIAAEAGFRTESRSDLAGITRVMILRLDP